MLWFQSVHCRYLIFFFQWLGHVGAAECCRGGLEKARTNSYLSRRRQGTDTKISTKKKRLKIKKKSVLWPTFDRKKNACVYFEPLLSVLTFLSTTTSWEQSHIVRKQLLEKSLFTIYRHHIICAVSDAICQILKCMGGHKVSKYVANGPWAEWSLRWITQWRTYHQGVWPKGPL